MISRQYTRKIQIYQTTSNDDGFGGSIPIDILVGSFWSEVKQNSAFRDTQVGISNIKNNYSFKIRSSSKITSNNIDNLFILYRSKKYVVNDIRFDDELFREVNITANGIN